MLVGITIDPWKLKIFEKRLTAAGYKYDVVKLNKAATVIRVESADPVAEKLPELIQTMNDAARRSKKH